MSIVALLFWEEGLKAEARLYTWRWKDRTTTQRKREQEIVTEKEGTAANEVSQCPVKSRRVGRTGYFSGHLSRDFKILDLYLLENPESMLPIRSGTSVTALLYTVRFIGQGKSRCILIALQSQEGALNFIA